MAFDFLKIEDFERHISLSIPNYAGLIDTVENVALEYLTSDGAMIDAGCSSGLLLNKIFERTDSELVGCDLVDMGYDKSYKFENKSALEVIGSVRSIDVISCLFTLQFMGRRERAATIAAIAKAVQGGAVAIIAEKIHLNNSRLNTSIYRAHNRGKAKSFTAEEIQSKDFDLSGSMFPLSSKAIERELEQIGDYEAIWQSYNFKCWCISANNNAQRG